MAYKGSKGFYVKELRKLGINKHPVELKTIELYKTYIVRNLYLQYASEKEN